MKNFKNFKNFDEFVNESINESNLSKRADELIKIIDSADIWDELYLLGPEYKNTKAPRTNSDRKKFALQFASDEIEMSWFIEDILDKQNIDYTNEENNLSESEVYIDDNGDAWDDEHNHAGSGYNQYKGQTFSSSEFVRLRGGSGRNSYGSTRYGHKSKRRY
jgi:hypothetical protein